MTPPTHDPPTHDKERKGDRHLPLGLDDRDGARSRDDRGVRRHPRRPAGRRGRRGHPPHAGLRRGDEGDRPKVRVLRVRRVCPNLHHRDAPGAAPDDAAAVSRANGGVPDEQLVGDVRGAVEHLRGAGGQQRQGRLSSATARAADRPFWPPASSTSTPPSTATARSCWPTRPRGAACRCGASRSRLPTAAGPLLGLFGADDSHPSPDGGRRARRDPDRPGQGARVPQLREGRARVLRRRPGVVPARGRRGGLAARPGLPRRAPRTPERWGR